MSDKSKQTQVMTDANYTEGSIKRIKLENIMTYDSVEFNTGPYLNVIIGPNGTGKSTIVCAICLGLAGKTSWLGRAQHPNEFIKYGCNKAKIEIELYNHDGDNYVIQREISKTGSSWTVNGRAANQKSVEELVSRLNIQVGNLTQFLPQEKVADFAKMTQQELLENTEKSVGDPEMYENHQKLKEARNTAKNLEQSYANLTERLEQEKQKNARVEQDVKNFEERETYLDRIKSLQMKRAWMEYEEKRQVYVSLRDDQKQKAEALKAARVEHAPLQKNLDAAKKDIETGDGQIKAKTAALKEVAKRAAANKKEVDAQTEKFEQIQDDLNDKIEQEQARTKRLHDLHKQLESLQKEHANTEETNVQPALEVVHGKMREVNQSMNNINHQGERVKMEVENCRREANTLQRELQELRDIENQRLELLRSKHRHTYDATIWLRQNRHLFKGVIYDPIMLCVNMKSPQMAKYLENHISFNDMRAFVCENTEDFNQFMNIMRDQQNLKINAVKMPKDVTLEKFRPAHPISRFKKYGFHNYLQDLFTCPEAVMKFLCAQYKVHQIPVGDHRTKDMITKIREECPDLTFFYTAYNQFSIKSSKYKTDQASRNTRLKEASLLTATADENRERELLAKQEALQRKQTEKENIYQKLQQDSQELDSRLQRLREEKKQLTVKKDLKKKLEYQIESKKKTISSVESGAVDIDTYRQTSNRKIKEISYKKYKNLKEYLSNTQQCVQLSMEKVRQSLRNARATRTCTHLETDLRERFQNLQHLEVAYERAKEQVTQCKEAAKKLLEVAKKSTGTGPNEELQPNIKTLFEQLPNSLEDIDSKIHEQQSRADCTIQTDKRVVDEYRQRKHEIAGLERQLQKKGREREKHQEEIEEARKKWLEPLTALVSRINNSFSHFFRCLKCAGEVDISVPENPEDYGRYGIRIKVKFRDAETLRELTAHHQSGGERSVATVLYMMALQELTKCPFRCVDEINQGMDPVNERKVFELVVKTVCKKSSSQYFLLTPKLLPDLEYAENMTVLCVYNGPHMLNHTDWKLHRFIRRRSRIED